MDTELVDLSRNNDLTADAGTRLIRKTAYGRQALGTGAVAIPPTQVQQTAPIERHGQSAHRIQPLEGVPPHFM